jgi:hypothetical protein
LKARGLSEGVIDLAELQQEVERLFGLARDSDKVSAGDLSRFIDEAEATLDQILSCLFDADSDSPGECAPELMIFFNRIRRSAAAIGLNRPALLTHLVEETLRRMNEGEGIAAALLDAIACCANALRTYMAGLRRGQGDSSNFCYAGVKLLIASPNGASSLESIRAQVPAATFVAAPLPTAAVDATAAPNAISFG